MRSLLRDFLREPGLCRCAETPRLIADGSFAEWDFEVACTIPSVGTPRIRVQGKKGMKSKGTGRDERASARLRWSLMVCVTAKDVIPLRIFLQGVWLSRCIPTLSFDRPGDPGDPRRATQLAFNQGQLAT